MKSVAPTGEQVSEAVQMAQDNVSRYSNDHDLNRSNEDWRKNVYQGALAEIVAEQYFSDLGFEVRVVDDDEDQTHDLEVEGLTVEVKLRRLWAYREPDYLLRHDDPENLDADIYLMVEADKSPQGVSFVVAKWASKDTAREHATGFRKDRPMIPREELDDISSLVPVLRLFEGDSQ